MDRSITFNKEDESIFLKVLSLLLDARIDCSVWHGNGFVELVFCTKIDEPLIDVIENVYLSNCNQTTTIVNT